MLRNIIFTTLLYIAVIAMSCEDDFENSNPTIVDQSFALNENSPEGTAVGTVMASDVDTDQTLTFSIISGNTNNTFEITNAGELRVANMEAVDYEQNTSFALEIQVLDDFQVSGSAQATVTINLTDQKITDVDLIAHYPFKGNANDESSGQNHGLVAGATLVEDRNGVANEAYDFDGVNDYITLGTSNVFALGNYDNFSVSFWVKPAKESGNDPLSIFSKYIASADNRVYSFLYRTTNNLSFSIYENGGTNLERSESAIADTDWHNVVWVYREGAIEMFKDGTSVASMEFSFPIYTGGSTAEAVIGAFHQYTTLYSGNFEGVIDDLRIYQQSLSPEDIMIIFREPE